MQRSHFGGAVRLLVYSASVANARRAATLEACGFSGYAGNAELTLLASENSFGNTKRPRIIADKRESAFTGFDPRPRTA